MRGELELKRDEIQNKVIEILKKHIMVDISIQEDYQKDLGAKGIGMNSIDFLEFLIELEKAFDTCISDELWDISRFNTVKRITDYFHKVLEG
jgi:acyl carrier protein